MLSVGVSDDVRGGRIGGGCVCCLPTRVGGAAVVRSASRWRDFSVMMLEAVVVFVAGVKFVASMKFSGIDGCSSAKLRL